MNLIIAVETVFWVSLAALAYTYAGYPILLFLISKVRPRIVKRGDCTPSVSIIITAYNEESALVAKLENTLLLDYPRDLVEVVVASDCSTDRTNEIARDFGCGVRLLVQPERLGKTAAQNSAVENSTGEIILFSDATSHYQSNVLQVIMPSFADPQVGCVTGRLVYVDPADSAVGTGARSYWDYETFLKRHESRAGSLIGASGCLYAVRRSAYVPLYHEACSDFIVATKMVEQGLRAIYEPNAICMEETNNRSSNEMKMRVRVIAQTFTDLWRHRSMLNPMHSGFYAVQLLSHKVMRYLVPFLLIFIFLTSVAMAAALGSFLWLAVFCAQLAFYMGALGAWLLEGAGVRSRLLALPHYFVLANLASLLACYKFMRGERYARWEPIRETVMASPGTRTITHSNTSV
jgi:cellulose synthase/poly-beta-1,6-N-acetylglucosamine synthase-like glycosyltransferase